MCTVLPQIMAQAFISFQQLFTPATKRERNYTRLAFISWSSESMFSGWLILMEAGDSRVADPVDAVHYEMDSTVRSYCVYKSV